MRLPGASSIRKGDFRVQSDVSRLRSDFAQLSELANQRSMTNKRLTFTVLTLLLTMFLAYSSLFYFPAYTVKSSVVRIATQDAVIPDSSETENSRNLNNYLKLLIKQRGYLRAGQSVRVDYNVALGSQIDVVIFKCNQVVIVEIYSCNKTEYQKTEIGSAAEGYVEFTVDSAGFYYFDEVVKNAAPSALEYYIKWSRN
ncbi:MAG: hypothetical protein ABJN69_16645 [Hellea sp.]